MYHLFNIVILTVVNQQSHNLLTCILILKHRPGYGNKYVYFQKDILLHSCMLGTFIFTIEIIICTHCAYREDKPNGRELIK